MDGRLEAQYVASMGSNTAAALKKGNFFRPGPHFLVVLHAEVALENVSRGDPTNSRANRQKIWLSTGHSSDVQWGRCCLDGYTHERLGSTPSHEEW